MQPWKQFELDCTRYLNTLYGDKATFLLQGGADATTPDILVQTKQGRTFYIEVKHTPAQCGQFVLLPSAEQQRFLYSSKNKTPCNVYAEQIIEHMNQSFFAFQQAGTKGKAIYMEQGERVFANWILQMYREKGVAFIITNGYTILPIVQLEAFFVLSATYRTKKSGSSNVGKSNQAKVTEYLATAYPFVTNIQAVGAKLFCTACKQIDGHRFSLAGEMYYFSLREKCYEIRKLAHTQNANVIFSIARKLHTTGLSEDTFRTLLQR